MISSSWNTMQVSVANATPERSLAAPISIWSDDHFATRIRRNIVNEQLERFGFVSSNQRKKVFGIVQDRIGSDDVIGKRFQTCFVRRTVRLDLEHVPNIFRGVVKRTESNRDAEQSLASPRVAWYNTDVAQLLQLAVVHQHLHFTIQVQLEYLFQRVVVLIQTSVTDGDNKIEIRLQLCS